MSSSNILLNITHLGRTSYMQDERDGLGETEVPWLALSP